LGCAVCFRKYILISCGLLLNIATVTASTPQGDRKTSLEPGMWSKQAVSLTFFENIPLNQETKTLCVDSPDKTKQLCVRPGEDEFTPAFSVSDNGRPIKGTVEAFMHPEAAWSPDSRSFWLTSTDGGLVGSWRTRVYVIRNGSLQRIDPTQLVKADMARAFPPCRTGGNKNLECGASDRHFFATRLDWVNVAAIKWVSPRSLLVVGQIPCSSRYGINMCKFEGYDIAVPSGRILARYDKSSLRKECSGYCGDWPP